VKIPALKSFRAAQDVLRITHCVLLLLFLLFLFFAPSVTARAQQPTPSDDEVNAIARQLFCPVCENTPLDVCPSQACHDWRELIRQMLAEGKTPDEIKQYFVDYYGAQVLSEPPRAGLNWLAYLVPPLAFLAGLYLLLRAFRTRQMAAGGPAAGASSTSRSSSGAGSTPSAEDDYVARLEEELSRRK